MTDAQARNELTFQTYEEGAARTAAYPGRSSGDLTYPALGLNGEAGEVAEKLKKTIRDHGGDIQPNREAIIKELGDVLWYLAACAHELNISLAEVAQRNLDKLADRAARSQIHGEGDER